MNIPATALSAPGLYSHMPLGGHPLARDITTRHGQPLGAIALGTVCGSAVVLEVTTAAFLDELESAIQVERAYLAMWARDHPQAGAA